MFYQSRIQLVPSPGLDLIANFSNRPDVMVAEPMASAREVIERAGEEDEATFKNQDDLGDVVFLSPEKSSLVQKG
jgi:hypothetical protein